MKRPPLALLVPALAALCLAGACAGGEHDRDAYYYPPSTDRAYSPWPPDYRYEPEKMRRRRDDGETRRGHRRERREHAHRHDRRKGDPIPREHARQPSDDGRRGLRGGGRGRL